MTISTAFHKQLDLPAWEMTAFAPLVSIGGGWSCAAQNSLFNAQHGRYIYYYGGASPYKYDTWTDTFIAIATAPVNTGFGTARFLSSYGFEGRVLSAAAGSVTIPAFFGQVLQGYDISIVSGTGIGQRRLIANVADATVADTGIATAVTQTATLSQITDSTKTWAINQWAGYQMRVIFGGGISTVRRILYNSATTLTFMDTTKYGEDNFCNPAAPASAFSATAGSQSVYQIESSVVSVDQNWSVTPDATSRFRVASGAILFMQTATTSALINWYDVVSDTWYVKSCPTLIVATTGTDFALEVFDEASVVWARGFPTAGTTTTLTDANQNWTAGGLVGKWVWIAYGTASGQMRKITANTATQLTFASGTAPDTTSAYFILGFDGGTATSGAATTLTDTAQAWATNRYKNYAVRILSGTGQGQVLPILSNTATALTVTRPWATNPDSTSVYAIVPNSDQAFGMMALNTAVYTYGIDDDLLYHGRMSDSGMVRNASVQYGGFKPLAIASATHATTTATITTANTHNLIAGQSITVKGMTDANYNTTATIATVPSQTTFTYTMAGTPAADTIASSVSTSVIVDASKSWTTNQWAGYLCRMANTTGAAPTGQTMIIASNTATTLTLTTTVTLPTNGTTRYIITPNTTIGAIAAGVGTGITFSTTQLQDTSQNWVVNIFAGRKMRITGGPGEGGEAVIASNSANILTFAAVGLAPGNGTSTYAVLGQPACGLGIEMRHAFGTSDTPNQGKYVIINRGGGALGFDRLNITTDLFEMMATQPQSETLTTGSMFAYDGVDRLYFQKDATQRMFYLNIPTSMIHGAAIYPYVTGTAIIGNRMEIFTTVDGLKFLWLNRHSNLECFRQLLFW